MSNLDEKVSYIYDQRFYNRMKDAQLLIDAVRKGEDPFDVVNEITKSTDIETIKLPVGIVKKKRKKDKKSKENVFCI
jgi:hypothetical protein